MVPVDTASWRRNRFVLLPELLAERVLELRRWVDAIEEFEGGWRHRVEATSNGPRIRRIENVARHHAGLATLLAAGDILAQASALLGTPAILSADEVDYEHPGGAGSPLRQDDYTDHPTIGCMIAVDLRTPATGCLALATGDHGQLLDAGARTATLPFCAIPMAPGDVLWFDPRAPRRMLPNSGPAARRAIFATYKAVSAGDDRTDIDRHSDLHPAGAISRSSNPSSSPGPSPDAVRCASS
jgi:hypothetical protein